MSNSCKIKIKWLSGDWSENTAYLSPAKQGWGSVESHVKHLKTLKATEDWQVIVEDKIVAQKHEKKVTSKPKTEDLKEQAKVLYKKHGSYAKVAKLIGKHPTTVRTWCNE